MLNEKWNIFRLAYLGLFDLAFLPPASCLLPPASCACRLPFAILLIHGHGNHSSSSLQGARYGSTSSRVAIALQRGDECSAGRRGALAKIIGSAGQGSATGR